jgi:hypothetical protein
LTPSTKNPANLAGLRAAIGGTVKHALLLVVLAAFVTPCACGSTDTTGGATNVPDAQAGPTPGQDAAPGDASGGTPSDAPGHATIDAAPDAPSTLVPGDVRFLGRVDTSDPSAPRFAWSGSGLVATVNGTKISVKLRSDGSDAFYQPVIDGTPGTRFSVTAGTTATQVLGDALPAGDHTVELYRESEGMYGDSVFLGFADGTLKGAPAGSGRLVEVIGDSISAGYGNLGNEVHPPWDNTCTFSLDTESAYQAYDMKLGRALDAEVSIVARSGWGMYRDLGGSTSGNVPSVYADAVGTNATPVWSFTRKADAVLVNLGTNDSIPGDPGQPFEDAYVAFLKTVRGHYPAAWIFLTIGPMTSDPMLTTMRTHLASVVSTFADPKVLTIDVPTQDATSTGCDYHPNVNEDQILADALAPAIRSKLGW